MDACLYEWLQPGSIVYWLRSSEEQPFIWTLFKGQIVAAYDVLKRFYYHCALLDIEADKAWIDRFVANNTFRFTAIDSGKPEHIYLYSDCTTNSKNFIEDWRHYYAQNYLWDLTADIVFSKREDAIKALQQIYSINNQTFKDIAEQTSMQLNQLTMITTT